MIRDQKEIIKGYNGRDGAGVNLVRVLSSPTITMLDPFLMLDIFDSEDYNDYILGFPMHPHRGIETITYLHAGEIDHQDSLGNHGKILPGGTQWMTAGSGIMHQEMPQKSDHMMGFQLWLNMAANTKMMPPKYREVNGAAMPQYQSDGIVVRVISGEYEGVKGAVTPDYVKPEIYDVRLEEGSEFRMKVDIKDTSFLYIFRGVVKFPSGGEIGEKNGVLLGEGDEVLLKGGPGGAVFMFITGKPLKEPVAWGGPIVMNTKEELQLAFQELREGTFLKTTTVEGTESLV
jgi:redox-sensitive bicupin YhaK (pirin superfamily)